MTTSSSVSHELSHRIAGDAVADGSPPSLDFIKALITDRTQYFQAFHKQCALEEEYYFLRRDIPTPSEVDFDDHVRPATARAIIDVATDHVDVDNLAIEIPLMLRSKARAEKIKKFLQGVWLNIRGPQKQMLVKHCFTYGIAFMNPMFDVDNWPDAPQMEDFGAVVMDGDTIIANEEGYIQAQKDFLKKRDLTFPFVLNNVNPKNMMWDDSRTGPKWAIKTVNTTAGAIRRMYPDWFSGKNDSDPTSWQEYWDGVWYAYLADGAWIKKPAQHGYGYMPFIPVVPGTALDWDEGPPVDRYKGILHPVHNLLDTEARLATQAEAILRTVAWRTLDFTGNQMSAQATADQYEMWGGKNVIPANVTVAPSPMINLPPDLMGQLDRVGTMIEEATFPNVVRGLRPTGISSGFGVSVLSGQGRLRFQAVANAVSRGLEQANRAWLHLVENRVRASVTVNARSEIHNFDQTINPKDINGYHENVVSLKAEAPEEREREALLARQLHDAGIISLYETQRRVGIVNPLEEQVQMASEKLLEGARERQLEEFLARLGENQQDQLAQAAGMNIGNQFQPGQAQLQRPGERSIQQGRSAAQQGRPSVFPQGQSGIDLLGRIGVANGGAQGVPSGQTVGRQP